MNKTIYIRPGSGAQVSITNNVLHEPVRITIHGIEVEGNLWTRFKTALKVIFRPGSLLVGSIRTTIVNNHLYYDDQTMPIHVIHSDRPI